MSEHIVPQRPELTAEYLRSVLHYEPATGIFTRKIGSANQVKTGDIAGSQNGLGYLQIKVCSRKYQAHRLAWLYVYGAWPTDQIDHINRIRTDNRIANLREVTNKQNQQNAGKRSDNTSGYQGVHWHKRDSRWVAQIKHSHKIIHLGYFTNIEEAISARKAAEKLYWADTQIAD